MDQKCSENGSHMVPKCPPRGSKMTPHCLSVLGHGCCPSDLQTLSDLHFDQFDELGLGAPFRTLVETLCCRGLRRMVATHSLMNPPQNGLRTLPVPRFQYRVIPMEILIVAVSEPCYSYGNIDGGIFEWCYSLGNIASQVFRSLLFLRKYWYWDVQMLLFLWEC